MAAVLCAVAVPATAAEAVARKQGAYTRYPDRAQVLVDQTVVPGELIVRYREGVGPAERASIRASANASFKRSLLLDRTELVRVGGGSARAAARALEARGDVEFAEPNRVARIAATPNDTMFSTLYGLHNTGQTISGQVGTADADIDAPEAWNTAIGQPLTSTRVAVLDTGVAEAHPDLVANQWRNPGESGGGKETNRVDDDGNGLVDDFRGWDFAEGDNTPSDFDGHGTHVAGTIAARTHNGTGISGVAAFPQAILTAQWSGPKIIPIKVLGDNGSGATAGIVDGIVYAGRMGAKVANLSLGGSGTSAAYDAAFKAATSANTFYAVAAGNNGTDNDTDPKSPCVPASDPDAPNKLCIAATDNRDALASFSNFGVKHVDLAAPGVQINSTQPFVSRLKETFDATTTPKLVDAGGVSGTAWAKTSAFSFSPRSSVTDSPSGPYQNNSNRWLHTPAAFATTGQACVLSHNVKFDLEAGYDYLDILMSTTSATSGFRVVEYYTAAAQGKDEIPLDGTDPSGAAYAFSNKPQVWLAYRLFSDSSTTADGVHLDNVEVKCVTGTYDSSSFASINGTSMATPHVAGAATFLAGKFPTATVAQQMARLKSGDAKASLTGKVATGMRLNLYKAASETAITRTSGVLTVAAGKGTKNAITITRQTDGSYRIRDPWSTSTTAAMSGSRLVPAGASGCRPVSETEVSCTAPTRIVVNAGEQDDTVTATSATVPVRVDGGTGNDTITTGGGADTLIGGPGVDRFSAGAGSDTINARNDDADGLFACGESTGDNDVVNADATPNDPVTASATACETVNKA